MCINAASSLSGYQLHMLIWCMLLSFMKIYSFLMYDTNIYYQKSQLIDYSCVMYILGFFL